MKFLVGMTALSMLFLVGCSSKKKDKSADEVVVKEEVIEVEKPTYVIAESSSKTRPAWIENPSLGDEAKERKTSRYFTNRSEQKNRRLCEQSAEARATASIAKEIAQFLKNSYTEGTQDGGDDEATTYMEETLARESQSFIVGSQVLKSFWERRTYQEEKGATENKTEYVCFALIKMPKKEIEKAVRLSRQKLLENMKTPEVKEKAQKALAGAELKFAELDKPVVINEEEADSAGKE